jgi:O-antigen/teichoic acid export membrane protein
MDIGRKDVLWNYAATFLKIGSSALLFPFVLRMMPSEMVGIWTVFMTITAFAALLDFGFNPSFARNVTYVFSGVSSLKTKGFETVEQGNLTVDYGLLKGVISAMRWFYFRVAVVLFILLASLGTVYIITLLRDYQGERSEVYIAWALLCIINTYSIFTLYYDSLLQGKGLIKRSKQIVIIGNMVYFVIAAALVIAGKGLVAIVSSQALSVIIIRWLSYRTFFSPQLKKQLHQATAVPKTIVLNAIYPNAVKIGLTSLGGFLVQRSAIIIGSLYLTLDQIACYGISMQLILILAGLAGIFTATYSPRIAQLRVEQNIHDIKELYLKGQLILILTFLIGGTGLLVLGAWGLKVIGSKTMLMPQLLLLAAMVVSFLESNHSMAGSILLSKNEVPFFKAALISGGATVLLLLLFFHYLHWGWWAMIAAPGIAQGVYQNWKWPATVWKELKINQKDISRTLMRGFHFH